MKKKINVKFLCFMFYLFLLVVSCKNITLAINSCKNHTYNSENGDYCIVCGYKYEPQITNMSTIMYAIKDNVPVWDNYYSQSGKEVRTLSKNESVQIKGKLTNSLGNLWYLTSNGEYIYSENLITAQPKNYSIKYDANGGTGTPQGTRYASGSYMINKLSPKREGYKFLGYSTNKNATTPEYQPGETILLQNNILLYAIWGKEEKICENHTYNSENGDYCIVCGYKYVPQITNMSTTMYAIKDNVPVWDNYYSQNGKEVRTLSKNESVQIKGKLTNSLGNLWYLTSDGEYVYSENLRTAKNYSIKYDANGGTGAPQGTRYASGSYMINKSSPKREGYKFLGYSTNKNATTPEYQPGETILLQNNILLYAIWGKEEKICENHTYNSENGDYCIVCGYKYEPQITNMNTTMYAIKDNVPVWDNYYSQNGNILRRLSKQDNVKIIGLLINSIGNKWYITDKYEYIFYDNLNQVENKTYTVQYNANGGKNIPSGIRIVSESATITINKSVIPIRSGYEFIGYSTNKNAITPEYNLGQKVTVSQDMTLYAIWRKRNYDLKSYPGVPQERDTCTSAALTVMLGRKLIVDSKDESFTYRDVRKSHTPFTPSGIYNNKYYSNGNTQYKITYDYLNNIKNDSQKVADYIATLLNDSNHPEGIVIYCYYKSNLSGRHAILISDYELKSNGDYQFYAYDSAQSSSLGRKKLEETYLFKETYKSNAENKTYKDIFSNIFYIYYVEKEVK